MAQSGHSSDVVLDVETPRVRLADDVLTDFRTFTDAVTAAAEQARPIAPAAMELSRSPHRRLPHNVSRHARRPANATVDVT